MPRTFESSVLLLVIILHYKKKKLEFELRGKLFWIRWIEIHKVVDVSWQKSFEKFMVSFHITLYIHKDVWQLFDFTLVGPWCDGKCPPPKWCDAGSSSRKLWDSHVVKEMMHVLDAWDNYCSFRPHRSGSVVHLIQPF